MDEQIFTQLQALLHQRCGLHFAPEQRQELMKGLHQAMLVAGCESDQEYYDTLRQASISDPVWKYLVSEVTIGETYFFRNSWHFKALREEVLPALIKRRRDHDVKMLRIWSAGCSTGEEAYSIAILLYDLLPDINDWHITLLATDINDQALLKAQSGLYGAWSFRQETPSAIREKYFVEHENRYEILPAIRQMVRFAHLNLVDDVYPSPFNDTTTMDIIICRNVTIYFDRPTTRTIIERFYRALADRGWLIVGHSEPLASIYTEYEVVNFSHAVFYRKLPPSTAIKAESPPPPPSAVAPPSTFELTVVNRLSPAEQEDILHQARQLAERGRTEEARNTLTPLLEILPDHLDALFLLAKITADEGKLDYVHEILDTIDSLNPLVPQAHYLRALLYQQANALPDAKAALRRALYADREFALAHYVMAELLYTEGNVMLARRSWENALSLLKKYETNVPIPFGDGMMVGTLLHAIEQRLKTVQRS